MAPPVRRRGVVVTVLFGPTCATRRDGCDGLNWPHLTVSSIRMARIAGHEGEGLEGEVKGGAVCGDSPRSPGRWVVDSRAGR